MPLSWTCYCQYINRKHSETAEFTKAPCMPPGDNRSISSNGSKCSMWGLNFFDVPELILHLTTISTTVRITKGDNPAITSNCSKSARVALYLLDLLEIPPAWDNATSKFGCEIFKWMFACAPVSHVIILSTLSTCVFWILVSMPQCLK